MVTTGVKRREGESIIAHKFIHNLGGSIFLSPALGTRRAWVTGYKHGAGLCHLLLVGHRETPNGVNLLESIDIPVALTGIM